jgi:hypothetical protein
MMEEFGADAARIQALLQATATCGNNNCNCPNAPKVKAARAACQTLADREAKEKE